MPGQYYTDWVVAYEMEYNAMMKRVAEWYSKQNFYRKDVKRQRKERETELTKKKSTAN